MNRRTKVALGSLAWQTVGFVAVIATAVGLLLFNVYRVETTHDQITQRIRVIERVEPADVLRECLGSRECRQVIRGVSERLERTERRDTVEAAPSREEADAPPQARQEVSEPPRQPPERPSTGARRSPKPREPQPKAKPPPARGAVSPAPVLTPAPPQPGKSGEAPAAEKSEGTKACLELVVSACVGASR